MEDVEIIGIILIFCGIIYIFLQGLGKLSDKGGEIETKLLSLKGGAGLILVALGITLLAVGGGAGGLTKVLSEAGIKSSPADSFAPKASLVPATTSPIPERTSGQSTPSPTSQHLSASVSSTPTPATPDSKTESLKFIGKESGRVSSQGFVGTGLNVGDYWNNIPEQVFLNFNIGSIPSNATLTSATLDFSSYSRSGDPFSSLGCLGVYEQNFGVPDAGDFFAGKPIGAVSKWCSDGDLSIPSLSNDLISVIQLKLGKSRFQIRVQFDKNTDNNDRTDEITLNAPILIVTYTEP